MIVQNRDVIGSMPALAVGGVGSNPTGFSIYLLITKKRKLMKEYQRTLFKKFKGHLAERDGCVGVIAGYSNNSLIMAVLHNGWSRQATEDIDVIDPMYLGGCYKFKYVDKEHLRATDEPLPRIRLKTLEELVKDPGVKLRYDNNTLSYIGHSSMMAIINNNMLELLGKEVEIKSRDLLGDNMVFAGDYTYYDWMYELIKD